ncbi:hypothetical protein [Streptomyces sp. NPDC001714]|uniref:hypothetical protein n=1 Tax=Streptomyces sp. NPDC001714 TaxID=3364603 RepID=UPI0036A748CC
MHIGTVELLLSHPLVMIGASGEMEDFVETPLSGPITPGASHLAVPASAQISTVRVRLWNGPHPDVGTVVFDSFLELPDGSLAIFDVDRVVRFVRRVGKPGPQQVTIRVDDLKRASRVDVVVNRGPGKASLQRIPGYALPGVDGLLADRGLPSADSLALILSETSIPRVRLATALHLVASEWWDDIQSNRTRLNSYRTQRIVEWLRGVYPEVPSGFWGEIAALIGKEISYADGNDDESVAVSVAELVVRRIEESYQSFLESER